MSVEKHWLDFATAATALLSFIISTSLAIVGLRHSRQKHQSERPFLVVSDLSYRQDGDKYNLMFNVTNKGLRTIDNLEIALFSSTIFHGDMDRFTEVYSVELPSNKTDNFLIEYQLDEPPKYLIIFLIYQDYGFVRRFSGEKSVTWCQEKYFELAKDNRFTKVTETTRDRMWQLFCSQNGIGRIKSLVHRD